METEAPQKKPMPLRTIRKFVLTIALSLVIFLFGYEVGQAGSLEKWGLGNAIALGDKLTGTSGSGIPNISLDSAKQSIDNPGHINFGLFWKVWDMMETKYIDQSKVDQQEMVYGAIKGMVASAGDPYTVFLTPEENQKSREDLRGSFEGVGLMLGFKDDPDTEIVEQILSVISPLAGMPAEAAGVKAGDLILKIGETTTGGMSVPEAVDLIRGDKGTSIQLTIYTEGDAEPRVVSLVRDTIVVASVEYKIISTENGNAGRVHVSRFGERTTQELEAFIPQILQDYQQGKMKGIVLDLRSNPGGFFQGAIDMVSEFVPGGVVVQQESADGNRTQFRATGSARLAQVPLVIAVNEGSASSAEITAGAIKELRNVKVVGKKTFGKGSVQEAENFPDGSGVHITTYRWLLPSGTWIDKNGVSPDVDVAWTAVEADQVDAQLKEAVKVLGQ